MPIVKRSTKGSALTYSEMDGNFDFLFSTGTFSVIFRDTSGSSGNDSQSFPGQVYTKIWNIVHINIFCQDITTSGMSPNVDLYLHGLPFKPSKTAYAATWVQNVNTFDGTHRNAIFFTAVSGQNHGIFSMLRDNADAVTMDVSEFDDGQADIGIQMSYFTDE